MSKNQLHNPGTKIHILDRENKTRMTKTRASREWTYCGLAMKSGRQIRNVRNVTRATAKKKRPADACKRCWKSARL